MKRLLETNNLSFSIHGKSILSSINIKIEEGEIIALLGESGAGKTTLLHLLAAIEEPTQGEILFEEKSLPPPSAKLIAGHPEIKLVKQDFGLFPNISLRDNIAYELRFFTKEYREERIHKLLSISKLLAISDKLPREVSGGEQQRCVIAKAIADEPKVLLLDEPFSHLDRRNKERLKNEIQEIILEENMACIFVTHEVEDAFGFASQLYILENGKIIQKGSPFEIYTQPATPYIAEITGEVNYLSKDELHLLFEKTSLSEINLIRPEWLIFSENGIPFEIKNTHFLGAYFLLEIETKEGKKLKVKNQSNQKIPQGIFLDQFFPFLNIS